MQLVFSFYLPVTTGYLVDTSSYLVVTSGYLITTTRYFWLLLVTPGYFLLLLVPRFCNNVFSDENHSAKFAVESNCFGRLSIIIQLNSNKHDFFIYFMVLFFLYLNTLYYGFRTWWMSWIGYSENFALLNKRYCMGAHVSPRNNMEFSGAFSTDYHLFIYLLNLCTPLSSKSSLKS